MYSFAKLIKQNTSYLAVSEAFSMIVLFSVTVIIARTLGDTVYGQFAFIIAFAQLFQVLADFGLNIIGVRELSINKNEFQKYLSNFLGIKLIVSFITFALILITTQVLDKPDYIKHLIYIAGGYIVFYTGADFLRSVFRAQEQFKYEAYTKISQHLLLLILVLFAARHTSLSQFAWSYFISAVYAAFITAWVVWKRFSHFSFAFDRKLIRTLIKESWPLALANVFVVIYFRIDTIMLSLMQSDKETGWYNAAYLLIFSLAFFAYIIIMSVYPRLTQLVHESLYHAKRLYRQSLLLVTVAGIVILGIAALIARHIIPLLYGQEFLPAVKIFYILALAVFFSYLAHVWLYTLNALGKQKIYTWATAIGMTLNLVLNFIFIPRYSYIGAAWTTVATEIVSGVIIFVACEKLMRHG